jgi:DNA-binding transcriptional LysR family regulator
VPLGGLRSPAYLREHGTPQRVEELSRHNCLTHAYFGHSLWHFEVAGQSVAVPVQGNISANEAMTLQKARWPAPVSPCCPPTRRPVRCAVANWCACCPRPAAGLNLNAVYTSRKHMPATLRSMLDFLVERFGDEPESGVGALGDGSILNFTCRMPDRHPYRQRCSAGDEVMLSGMLTVITCYSNRR